MNWTRWKRAAEHVGDGLDRQRLRQAGHALDQEVAAREQADEDALEHLVLARDHALDLEEARSTASRSAPGLDCSQSLPFHALPLRTG